MLGTDLAREVRQTDSTVAVIMLSGQGSKQTEAWIRDGLIFDFVMKPVAIQELTKKIDSARKEHDARCARSETGHGKHESSGTD
jgi:DNA-binding response OmpR family regulator